MSSTRGRRIVTLLTDFGEGSYVASVKGVLLGIARDATLVDITHTVEPGEVTTAGFLLHHTAHYFPEGTVHLAVVDPGVGSERLPLILEAGGQLFVGPDNGLFGTILANYENVRSFSVDRGDWLPGNVAPTFHGRDLFAPAAAMLAAGTPPEELGSEIEPGSLVASPVPLPEEVDGCLEGRVIWVDRFGNLITDLSALQIEEWAGGAEYKAMLGWVSVESLVRTFSDADRGKLAMLFGSWQTLEIIVNEGSAADRLGVASGEPVRLERLT